MPTLYHIDAFTQNPFGGNPAAVCHLEQWLSDDQLQAIASENFLPETAFFIALNNHGYYQIRWFTPDIEMDLCGHATLATAHVIFNHLNFEGKNITFQSASGTLHVSKEGDFLTLDFPSRIPEKVNLPEIIAEGIGIKPLEVYKSRDYVLIYDCEQTIRDINPNQQILNQINLDPGGIIVTAKGNNVDFVSRFFTPQASIFEDPVTGSAHCSLIPFWSTRLGKQELTAIQLSKREGYLKCVNSGSRVKISGRCCTFSIGQILM